MSQDIQKQSEKYVKLVMDGVEYECMGSGFWALNWPKHMCTNTSQKKTGATQIYLSANRPMLTPLVTLLKWAIGLPRTSASV